MAIEEMCLNHGHGLIYGLVDPRNKEIFYIGKTENHFARYGSHLYANDKCNITKNARILEIQEEGMHPEFIIIEDNIPINNLTYREFYWIWFYINKDIKLTNSKIAKMPTIVYIDDYLIFDLNSQGQPYCRNDIALGSHQWLAWLENLTSFHFQGKNSIGFTARRETRENKGNTIRQGTYWSAYRKYGSSQKSKQFKHYIGMSQNLSVEKLENAAETLEECVNSYSIAHPQKQNKTTDENINKEIQTENTKTPYNVHAINKQKKREKELANGQLEFNF